MRLLTRSDFDGLVCGALLKSRGVIDTWHFVHPKDVQDGKIAVTENDVLANIPYVPGCGMWFDHHATEITRMGKDYACPGECRLAPSAARVIYEYYGGEAQMPHFASLVQSCDKVDSGNLTAGEIQHPTGGVLLGFIMDPRTGLGRFRNFSISNLDLMVRLLDCCATMSVQDILDLPDVRERIDLYWEQTELFRKMLLEKSRVEGNVVVTDLRGVDVIYSGNRFLIYSLFPDQNVSVWVVDGRGGLNTSIGVGYSVLNKSCKSDVGALCFHYGGGGHRQVGTCQVDCAEASGVIGEIVSLLVMDENTL